MDIFWESSQNLNILGVISLNFSVFSHGQGTEWGVCFGLLKFKIFLVVLEITDNFWVNGRCWARAYI